MVSNKKSVKRFRHSGKRQTKRYTDCVDYVKSKGAKVEEPEVEELIIEVKEKPMEPMKPGEEEETPEPMETEEEEETPEPEELEEELMEPEGEEQMETEEEEEEQMEEEEETVPSTNDFRFEEPENFKVQGEFNYGDRVVVNDPLSLQNARAEEAVKEKPSPEPELKMNVIEPVTTEKKEKPKPRSPRKKKSKKSKRSKKKGVNKKKTGKKTRRKSV